MNPSSPLSREQLEYFKTHGFLILENLIDELSVNQWREQIWHELDSSFDRPDSWPRHRSGLDGYQYDPPESAFGRHPALAPIIQQLGGGNFSTTGGGENTLAGPPHNPLWRSLAAVVFMQVSHSPSNALRKRNASDSPSL